MLLWRPSLNCRIVKDGFASTSVLREGTKAFTKENTAIMEIRVPKGARALYLGTDQGKSTFNGRWFANNAELLLNRGTRFRVVEQRGNHTVVEVIK